MEFEGRKKVETDFNIAPLIDIVFLLLIFFMLSSHFVTQPGIKITLPTASTAKFHPEEEIIVSISNDNSLYLNEKMVSLESLPDKLRVKIREAKQKTVIIRADEKIDLGLAVKVLDIAKKAEAEGLLISTKTKEDAKQ
ncbi:MAG: biopolymer transporter ExbD [Candidatus Omnitrophica bacterium]|nr:biopolymer transporter ExbD [Candidatus Omnitrophota bacterium]